MSWFEAKRQEAEFHDGGFSGRRIASIRAREFPASVLKSNLMQFIKQFAERYLGTKVWFTGAQFVEVPAGLPDQTVHRDHQYGARKAVTVVISLDGSSLTTLFHVSSMERIRYPDSLKVNLVKQLTSPAPNMRLLIFDPHIYHAGLGNATAATTGCNRVFLNFVAEKATLVAKDLDKKFKHDPSVEY